MVGRSSKMAKLEYRNQMGSNLSEWQADLLTEFKTATFILDPEEGGQKLKKQALFSLLARLPIRVIEPSKQVDQMTPEESEVLFYPKTG